MSTTTEATVSAAHLPYGNRVEHSSVSTEEFSFRGHHYRVEVMQRANSNLVWNGYRVVRGMWERIPAMSRTECMTFPKCVAKRGVALFEKFEASRST